MTTMPTNPLAPNTAEAMDATDFAELVRAFNEVTARLESTHGTLQREVAALKQELAEAQARLRRSRQLAALGEMAAGIAHEIRNPLGAIGLTLEALTQDLEGQPEQLELCGRVSRAVVRLDGIVGDVLSFARDTTVRPAMVDLSRPLLMAIESIEDLVCREDIDLDLDIDDGLEAEVDAPLLEQAVLNVLRNACEAMAMVDRRRRLSITLSARELRDPTGGIGSFAVIEVMDTGAGIPAEVRDRMFNPFFTTRAEGTGLGLAIVHRIVDAHGGRLDVQSGKDGTKMTFALPTVFRGESTACDEEDGTSLGGAVRRRVRDNADLGAA